jgi:hypothetical protein
MMLLKRKILFGLVLLIIGICANAQIFGVGYNAKRPTQYYINQNNTDSVYIYNANERRGNLFTQTGTLKAISPDSTKGYTFVWGIFNTTTKTFQTFDSIVNDSLSVKSGLASGGYSVRMIKDTIDTTFYAWVFINRLRMHIQKSGDSLPIYSYGCKYINLRIMQSTDPRADTSMGYFHSSFTYYNPLTIKSYSLNNSYNAVWNAIPNDDGLTFDNNISQHITVPPTGRKADKWHVLFTINYTDVFNNSGSDSVIYSSIVTRAKFKPQHYKYSPKTLTYAQHWDTLTTGEAPLKMMFKDSSLRAKSVTWIPSDTVFPVVRDSNNIDSIIAIYEFPRTYKVKLVSVSPEGCIDTSQATNITVLPAKLWGTKPSFPTAFNPGDSKYKYFFFKDDSAGGVSDTILVSIRNLHMQIFNQWGNKVYEYNGPVGGTDDPNNWHGWNGKTLLGDAPKGLYYYYYTAESYGGPIVNPKGSGYFYLLRDN